MEMLYEMITLLSLLVRNFENLDKLQVGFICTGGKNVAEEMNIENNIVSVDEDNRMDYEKIVVPLVKAVQEQQIANRRTASPDLTFDVSSILLALEH